MDNMRRRLFWHGMLLFTLGLVTGLVEQKLKNPRMGLAAHLEGLMNGTFLIAVGAAWREARLSPFMARAAFGLALYGGYANWATTVIAALLGTAAMTPLTSGTFKADAWQEMLVVCGFVSVGLAMLVASGILTWSFRGNANEAPRAGSHPPHGG